MTKTPPKTTKKEEQGVKTTAKKSKFKKIALVLSLCAIIIWSLLGTGASLAWFTDTSPEINNIFHFAEFDLLVEHELTDGYWEEVTSQTKVFSEEALYEPGYVEVVYLRVTNNGTIPFEFFTAVNVNGYIVATNVFGQQFSLHDYLRFGLVTANTPQEMRNSVPDREAAVRLSTMKLHNYHTDTATLGAGESVYIALIVRMPEDVGNIANYRGDTIPKVELGITVKADQIKK